MLSAFIWIPIVSGALLGLIPGSVTPAQIRWLSLAVMTTLVGLTLVTFNQFDLNQAGLQMQQALDWIPLMGLNYQLSLDGLSLSMLALNVGLTWIAILGTPDTIQRPRLFYSLLLLVNGAVSGAFLAQNLLLFFLFYEFELIPFFLLISIWGGSRREYAAIKFLLYTAVSGILMLTAFLGLYWLTGSFDFATLQIQSLPQKTQILLLLLVVVAFGIKIPLIPFHTWLPDAYVEASAPVAMILGGVLAKLGTYGLLRFGLQLFPAGWASIAPVLASWGAISILVGALVAIAQKDIKRMVAYSSVGHMGYILLGCAAATPLALVGAIAQMVSHGLILAILFHQIGVIEQKVGTRDLDVLNGLLNPLRGLPSTSALLILGAMASAGIPGLVGFIAEFLVFQGSYALFGWQTLVAVFGTGLTAVYFVILLNRTCFGRLDNATAYYPAVTWIDRAPALIMAVVIIALGIQPSWLVRWVEPLSNAISATVPTAMVAPVTIGSALASLFHP